LIFLKLKTSPFLDLFFGGGDYGGGGGRFLNFFLFVL